MSWGKDSAHITVSALFDDFNGDGKVNLFVANDSYPNYLYRNLGDGTFKEDALASGVAFNADGASTNMGVAIGDYDNDRESDLLATTFSEITFHSFTKDSGFYEDISSSVGRELPLPC